MTTYKILILFFIPCNHWWSSITSCWISHIDASIPALNEWNDFEHPNDFIYLVPEDENDGEEIAPIEKLPRLLEMLEIIRKLHLFASNQQPQLDNITSDLESRLPTFISIQKESNKIPRKTTFQNVDVFPICDSWNKESRKTTTIIPLMKLIYSYSRYMMGCMEGFAKTSFFLVPFFFLKIMIIQLRSVTLGSIVSQFHRPPVASPSPSPLVPWSPSFLSPPVQLVMAMKK